MIRRGKRREASSALCESEVVRGMENTLLYSRQWRARYSTFARSRAHITHTHLLHACCRSTSHVNSHPTSLAENANAGKLVPFLLNPEEGGGVVVSQVEWMTVALAFCKRACSSDASSWSKELLPLSKVKAAMFSSNRLEGSGRRAVDTEELQRNVALSIIKVRFFLFGFPRQFKIIIELFLRKLF